MKRSPINPIRGRVFLNRPPVTREMRKDREDADALFEDETIAIPMPTGLDVTIYYSSAKDDWVSHVILKTKDVENGNDGFFGSEWRWKAKPTRDQIRAHIVDMLDHEVRHQLGMDPHAEDRKVQP